jgi:hypothetical protein
MSLIRKSSLKERTLQLSYSANDSDINDVDERIRDFKNESRKSITGKSRRVSSNDTSVDKLLMNVRLEMYLEVFGGCEYGYLRLTNNQFNGNSQRYIHFLCVTLIGPAVRSSCVRVLQSRLQYFRT